MTMQKRSIAHRLDNLRCRIVWWLHKHRMVVCVISLLIGLIALELAVRDIATGPRLAVMGWDDALIYLATLVLSALVSAATAPKPKDPDVIQSEAPKVKDGQGVVRVYGTVWIDDAIVLGWQQLGTDPIKSKGGKK